MSKYPCIGSESPDLSLLPASIPAERIWSDPELYLKAAEALSGGEDFLLLPLSNTLEAEAVGAPTEKGPVRVRRSLFAQAEDLNSLPAFNLDCEHLRTIQKIRSARPIIFGLSGLFTLISQITDLGRALVAVRKGRLEPARLFRYYRINVLELLRALPRELRGVSLADPPLAPEIAGPKLFRLFLEDLYRPLLEDLTGAGFKVTLCPRLALPMREWDLLPEHPLIRGGCLKRQSFQVYLHDWAGKEKTVKVPAGVSLAEFLREEGCAPEMPCNGAGTCGKCDVLVSRRQGEFWTEPERVPACQTLIREELKIWPASPAGEAYRADPSKIAEGVKREISGSDLGLAVDIGTTGVVLRLVNLSSAEGLAETSFLNPQTRFGLDVMARIGASADYGQELRSCLVEALREQVERLIDGYSQEALKKITFSGNTAMLMLLLGEDATPLGLAPYRAPFTETREFRASEIGLIWPGDPRCRTLPVLSGHLGSDVLGGLLSSGLDLPGPPALFMDVGTNNEIVLRARERLLAASCAAGPALEGATIRFGSRAVAGALEDLRLGDKTILQVIGGGEAKSICGSGILALVREGLRHGLIDRRGRIAKLSSLRERDPRRKYLDSVEDKPVIRLSGELYVTQKDIRHVQLAKTAILSGVSILLREAGLESSELTAIYLAGQFGAHLSGELLRETGLLPEGAEAEVILMGNSSLAGASRILTRPHEIERMNACRERAQVYELSAVPDYERVFIASALFPEPKGVKR